MIRLARSALAGLALAGLALAGEMAGLAGSALARSGAYLIDLIRTEPYRSAWTRMLGQEHNLPDWIKDFVVTGSGVNSSSQMVPVGTKPFTYATLCKAHDCADNMLYVVFAPDGSKAYAKLVEAGKAPRLFGKPNAEIQAALASAASQ